MGFNTHMKAGLKVRNWAGIITTFHPFYTSAGGIFLINNDELPPVLPWVWDIPEIYVPVMNIGVFLLFLRVYQL